VPDAPPTLAFTALEIRLLDQLAKDKGLRGPPRKSMSTYLTKIARLGGYLARASDSPPGNMVIWRGLSRLTDIEMGFLIGAKLVGNRKFHQTLTLWARVNEDIGILGLSSRFPVESDRQEAD
jgi:hypothetical protein